MKLTLPTKLIAALAVVALTSPALGEDHRSGDALPAAKSASASHVQRGAADAGRTAQRVEEPDGPPANGGFRFMSPQARERLGNLIERNERFADVFCGIFDLPECPGNDSPG